MTKRQRVSEVAGTSAIETGALRLGVTRKTRTNLAPNPTCSVNTTGWVGNAGTGGGGASGRGSGATGLLNDLTYHRTTFTVGPSVLNTAGTTIGSAAAGASAIAVVPGWVSITAYARSSVADRTARIQATFYNAAGAAIGTAIDSGGPATAIGTGWNRLFWLGDVPAAAARVTVRIYAVAGANYVNGSTFDTGALLVETNSTVADTIDGYFDGDSSIPWVVNAWTGTAGASTSTAVYSANLLPQAPNANTSTPANFPPGMSAWLAVGGTGYPDYGMLVVHKADAPASVLDTGICVQTLYPDADSTLSHSSKTYSRTWNDQLGWNEWTSARIVSDKVGNDLYLQVAEPDFPQDGDLWISPGDFGVNALGLVPGGYAQIVANSAAVSSTVAVPVTGLSVTVTLSATRRYRVSVQAAVRSSVVNDRVGVQITDNGTLIHNQATTVPAVANVSENHHSARVLNGPAAGTHTIAVQVAQGTGATGGVFLAGAATTVTYLMVEDIGEL